LTARLGAWRGSSRQRIINAVDATVRAADPDAAHERREAADRDRYIAVDTRADGMADIYGSVAAAAAKAFDRWLSQLAASVCPANPRTWDQRRANAVVALSQGCSLACGCGQAGCPTRAGDHTAPPPGGVQVVRQLR
jgi:hypothetical protein